MAPDLTLDLRRTTILTPLGPFGVLVGAAGVIATSFPERTGDDVFPLEVLRESREDRRGLAPVRREVAAYFARRLRSFETPADLSSVGDGFSRRALEIVRTIPYGEMWTYGDVAAAAGAARGGRAAGSALARCPVELFVPCHRVVRAGPALGSYGRHDDRRRFLLELEGALPRPSARPVRRWNG